MELYGGHYYILLSSRESKHGLRRLWAKFVVIPKHGDYDGTVEARINKIFI